MMRRDHHLTFHGYRGRCGRRGMSQGCAGVLDGVESRSSPSLRLMRVMLFEIIDNQQSKSK